MEINKSKSYKVELHSIDRLSTNENIVKVQSNIELQIDQKERKTIIAIMRYQNQHNKRTRDVFPILRNECNKVSVLCALKSGNVMKISVRVQLDFLLSIIESCSRSSPKNKQVTYHIQTNKQQQLLLCTLILYFKLTTNESRRSGSNNGSNNSS